MIKYKELRENTRKDEKNEGLQRKQRKLFYEPVEVREKRIIEEKIINVKNKEIEIGEKN